MSDKFKFRAWDKFNDMMWYQKDSIGLFFTNMEELEKGGNGIELMQFTGFKLNDVDIYDGDLINLSGKYIYEVRFEDGVFVLYHAKTHSLGKWGPLHRIFDRDFGGYKFEVIGNIHQHKHLLE